jgi:ribose transport system substrate-binding protein
MSRHLGGELTTTRRKYGTKFGRPALLITLASTMSVGVIAGWAGAGPALGATGSSYVAQAEHNITVALAKPTKILETKAFTPKRGELIYNISCNLAIVGCSEISGEVGDAVKALGDKFGRCNAGPTTTQAQGCFTDAVNAKAAAIVDNDVPAVGSGSGYSQAAAAHIPIIGAFTANPESTPDEPTQAAENAPTVEAQLLADYVIAKSNGKADVLYVGEDNDQDGVFRGKSFDAEMAKCTTCTLTNILTNNTTIETTGGPAITAALEAHPKIDWVVGSFDEPAALAVLATEQLGRSSTIKVGGMDADPQNLQYIKEGKVQVVDATVGQGEVAWAAVYAASEVLSGIKVPLATPVNIWLIDTSNISQVGSNGLFFGPNNYQGLFEALWQK